MIPVWVQISLTFMSMVVGICSGWIGAHIGMRVGIAKLETWKVSVDSTLDKYGNRLAVLGDDSNTWNTELELVLRNAGLPRVSRQRIRD